ncbi:restriction endonuclease [Reinekea marinisedimentorum]|uniref:Restriction system protein n=1 Tax=Reinekea marinisedimentorum TaxID=230495 RepID=A0A4R3I9N0_9GAMM|nr:restriction endonuclease [Reinekea marinisedimentorum]TCS42980.1 restriction system protein [Reinekea marinisedimentorum]
MLPPWKHTDLDISPTEFEHLVKDWVEKAGKNLISIDVKHNQKLEAYDSTYQIDVVAKFEALGGDFVVLIECKKHKSAIPRSLVQELHDKVRSIGAHKGMLFATTGFQSGALQYAKAHGIALVRITDGNASYETRSTEAAPEPPAWRDLPAYMGWLLQETDDGKVGVSAIDFRENTINEITQ